VEREVVVMSCHVPGPMHGPGAWTCNMAPVYTHAQSPHLHHLPSTPEYGKQDTYVADLCRQPPRIRIRMHNSYPPAASNLKAAPQRVGALAGSCGWSAGTQIGARLTRLFPACHCQCLVSLRARPFRLRARVRFRCAHLLFCSSRASKRCPLARSRCARSPLCRLLPRRGARWVGC
jgi:hypothetical protein